VVQFIPRVWPLILQFRVFTAPINILFPSRFVPEATQIHAGLRHYGLRSAVYVCACKEEDTRRVRLARRRFAGTPSRTKTPSTRCSINVENRRNAQKRVPIIFDLPCVVRGGGEDRPTARLKGESRSSCIRANETPLMRLIESPGAKNTAPRGHLTRWTTILSSQTVVLAHVAGS